MGWYKRAQQTQVSDDGRQKGWEDNLGDVQRYTYDPYTVRVYKTRLGEGKITLAITLSHIWSGGIVWQDFWRYVQSEDKVATGTYKAVTKAADEVFQKFRSNEIPNLLLHTYLREAVRWIDQEHKPTSRVPYIDWARGQNCVKDWRNSIYGTRYPIQTGY